MFQQSNGSNNTSKYLSVSESVGVLDNVSLKQVPDTIGVAGGCLSQIVSVSFKLNTLGTASGFNFIMPLSVRLMSACLKCAVQTLEEFVTCSRNIIYDW